MTTQDIKTIEKHDPAISGRAGELVAMAERCTIQTVEDLEKASDLLKFIKSTYKKAEEERKAITDPINASVKILNSRFKAITDPLSTAEGNVKGKILAFEQERRRKAEEEAREQARLAAIKAAEDEARRKAEEEAAKAIEDGQIDIFADPVEVEVKIDEASLVIPEPVVNNAPVRGAYGSTTSVVKRWTFRVTDIAALAAYDKDLVAAVSVEINKRIRDGVRDIPGLDIYQDETISSR